MPLAGDERMGVLDARAWQGGERRRCNNNVRLLAHAAAVTSHVADADCGNDVDAGIGQGQALSGGGCGGGREPQVGWAIITEEAYKK